MVSVAALLLDAWDEERGDFKLSVEVGLPYQAPEGEWRCQLSVDPLQRWTTGVAGLDSFQALCLAIRMVEMCLTDFVERGGSLKHSDDGGDFLPAPYFGPFSFAPGSPPAG